MRITYGGAAHRMYADPTLDGCQAVEMAPAVWQIYIEDYNNTECPVVTGNMGGIGDPLLRKLNVVVQKGMVRKIDDPYKPDHLQLWTGRTDRYEPNCNCG